MEAQGPLRGAQPLVDLQKLLADVFDNILADFTQLSLPGPVDRESADQRKQRLLQHLHGSRQQLLRAVALLNWKPWKVLSELVGHERLLDIAAGHVRALHEVVGQLRQQAAGRIMAGAYLNMFDVNTALEVLTTGTYQELPSIILHRPPLFQPPPASLARQRSRLAHVTHLIRARLVQVALPPGLKVVSVSNGAAVLRAEGLYEAKLTLVPSEPLPGLDEDAAGGGAAAGTARGPGVEPDLDAGGVGWAAGAAAAAADPVAAAAAAQRWKWRLIHFVLCIGVPFYDPRQPGQILNTCNFHMVLAADNAAYLRRQRQGTAAANASTAGGAAPSTVSESAATPAASGLHGPGGGLGVSPAAGGSLAAAVRRTEDDEVGAPLAVMHAILTDVAGRLLADELAAAARGLAAPGSRWHGHISVKPSQLLHPGVRIEYWVTAPPLLSQCALPAPAAGEDFRGVKPGPPYLELGMGEGGCVEVLHSPCSLHKPVAVSKLQLDTFRVNVEEVLMRAANMCAQSQLLQVRKELMALLVKALGRRAPILRPTTLAKQLWCRDGHAPPQQPGAEQAEPADDPATGTLTSSAGPAGDGAATAPSSHHMMDIDEPLAPPPQAAAAAEARIPPPSAPPPEVSGLLARAGAAEEAAGALVVLNAPVLECLVAGTTELKIGKHLFSGRLTLRPGQDERDEGSLDHAAAVAMDEDYVNQSALSAYSSAPADTYPAARALREACRSLSCVLLRVHNSTDVTHFFQAARRASLHISRLPRGLVEAFSSACPGLAIEARPRDKVATWALQSLPFPPGFPPLEPAPPDTPPLRVPQCLTFLLQSRLSLTSNHVLLVCAANRQLMPIKVLSCIPVPPSAYLLPDDVVAAYRAACSYGGAGGTGGGSHGGGHAVSYGLPQQHPHLHQVHSTPHSGASSPRLHAATQEHLPVCSPDASPTRDSSAMGAAGCTAAGISGNPSLPSAASPPPPQYIVQSKQASPSGAQQHRGGGGAPHSAGRPTGQLVAVMLAQQQLSSVVRWCRRRMVWEVLLVQLQAVGAAVCELSHPPCQRLRVERLAGVKLPCAIARRQGLTPARIGPVCLELELGPDVLAGQVTARLYGTFLCSPACVPGSKGCDQGSLFSHSPSTSASVAAGAASAGFVLDSRASPRRASATTPGLVCLRRQYCLERGDSALSIVQDVAAVIRMQTLLARLEMTAPPAVPAAGEAARQELRPQQLAVLAPPTPRLPATAEPHAPQSPYCHNGLVRQQQPHPQLQGHPQQQGWLAGAAGPTAGYDGGGGGIAPAAKRIKTEPGTSDAGANGYGTHAAGASGGWPAGLHLPSAPNQPHAAAHAGHANGYASSCHGNGDHLGKGPYGGVAAAGATAGGYSGGGRGLADSGGAACRRAAAGAAEEAAEAGAAALTWHWPLVGRLALESYSCSAATLRFTPCSSTTGIGSGSGSGSGSAQASVAVTTGAAPSSSSPTAPTPDLELRISWAPRDVRHSSATAAASAASPASPPHSPGVGATPAPTATPALTAPSPAPPPFVSGSAAAAASQRGPGERSGAAGGCGVRWGGRLGEVVRASLGCGSGHCLPPEFLHALEEYAEAGEEGKLLDAVAVAAWPLAGLCAAVAPPALAALQRGAAELEVRLLPLQPPYAHRLVCSRNPGGVTLLLDLRCLAVGRSYLKLSIPSLQPPALTAPATSPPDGSSIKTEPPGSGGGSSSGSSSPAEAVLRVVQQLAPVRLGPEVAVSVGGLAAAHAGPGPRPASAPGPGAPLCLLLPNAAVQRAVELVCGVMAA